MPKQLPFPYTTDPEKIPTKKNLDVTRPDDPCIQYACPDGCWLEHLKAWGKEYRRGNKGAPQPQPCGHCMFERPIDYGMVPYGCTDQEAIRAAWEHATRSLLHGWDRDLPKEKLDAIVKATVDAKMKGEDLGAAPFVACIYAAFGD